MSDSRRENASGTAANLFFNALLENSAIHVVKSEQAAERGSLENRDEHLLRALKDLEKVADLITDPEYKYPRLSDVENIMLHGLEASEFFEQTPPEKNLLKSLRMKAWGANE